MSVNGASLASIQPVPPLSLAYLASTGSRIQSAILLLNVSSLTPAVKDILYKTGLGSIKEVVGCRKPKCFLPGRLSKLSSMLCDDRDGQAGNIICNGPIRHLFSTSGSDPLHQGCPKEKKNNVVTT